MITPNEFWAVLATPGLVVTEFKLNSIIAGFEFVTELTLKNLKPLSAELNPSPPVSVLSVYCCKPSTYISSLILNGDVENPNTGVTSVQVAIPVDGLYCNWLTVEPLLLFIANISCVIDCNPFGSTIILTSLNELPVILAPIMAPDLSSRPVRGFTMTKSGNVV